MKSKNNIGSLLDVRREPNHPVVRAFVIPKIKHINKICGNGNSGVMLTSKNLSVLYIGRGNGFFSNE